MSPTSARSMSRRSLEGSGPPMKMLSWHRSRSAWLRHLKHTSTTDVALTETGEEQAKALGPVLADHDLGRVLCSPLQRAAETARLAGFPDVERTDLLIEFRYGDYEGLTTPEIREE